MVLNEYIYDENDDEEGDEGDNMESEVGVDYIDNNNDRELMDDDTNTDSVGIEEKKDLVLIEMTVIIVLIIVCGVLYGGWRFLIDRREKQRELNYYINNELLAKDDNKL